MDKFDIKILARRAWLLIIAALIGGIGAFTLIQLRPTVYQAHAQLMVGPGIESPNPDLNVLRAGGQLIQMYAELPLTEPYLVNVINELGLDLSPEELAKFIEIRPNQDTQILTVQVQHTDGDLAQAVATSIAKQLVRVSPSNPESAPALVKDQMRVQIGELEQTVVSIEETIPQLQIKYEKAVEEEKLSRGAAGSFQYISEQLTQYEQAVSAGTASMQSETGIGILQELVINTNARILMFERQLKEDTNTTTQKLIIDQIRLERSHLSNLQQAIAEIQRLVEGMPLNQYIEASQAKIAALETEMARLNIDLRRLQLDRINMEQGRLNQARLIESNRQKLILEQIADERERISQVELASIEKQRLILEQITIEQRRLTETQNTLALLYNSVRSADPNKVTIIELPSKSIPISSSLGLAAILGALVTSGLAGLGVLAVERMDDRVRTSEQFTSILPVPILDVDESSKGFAGLLKKSDAELRRMQQYQMLGINLLYTHKEKEVRLVLVSATDESASAGTVAANLATTLTQSGKRVILVDLEEGHPVIAPLFGLHMQEGVSDFLFDSAARPSSMVSIEGFPSLYVWPYGNVEIDPALLMSPRMVQALHLFTDQADIVLCAVPMAQRPDTLLLASRADGVILVTTKGKTDEKTLQDVGANMKMVDATVLAAVLKSDKETGLRFNRRRKVLGLPAAVS